MLVRDVVTTDPFTLVTRRETAQADGDLFYRP